MNLSELSGQELSLLSVIIADSLSRGMSTADISVLGTFFSSIGFNLSTIAAQQALQEGEPVIIPE